MPQSAYPRIATDETLMETIAHGCEAYPFAFYNERMSMFDFHRIDWHWHTELEFIYVESGSITVSVGQNRLELAAGSGLVINSRELHQIVSVEEACIPNFLCSPEFLAPRESLLYRKYMEPFLTSGISLLVLTARELWQQDALNVLHEIIDLQHSISETTELETMILFQQLWLTLFRNTDLSVTAPLPPHTSTEKGRLLLMLEFLQTHYRENISLEHIALQAAISKSTATSLFKKYLDITPVEYLISYRLKKAAGLLAGTEKTVNAVALLTGFENTDYFCRSFKKHYGVTPTEYRKTRTDHNLSAPGFAFQANIRGAPKWSESGSS